MSSTTQELMEIINELPEEKAREVVDFARFLQQKADDQQWERIIAEKRSYPRLEKFAAEALHEGPAKPLDPSKL